jgi:hypothetical protein
MRCFPGDSAEGVILVIVGLCTVYYCSLYDFTINGIIVVNTHHMSKIQLVRLCQKKHFKNYKGLCLSTV